ncbi:3-methyl-2-oxobutanoate hydroxymethyltransferase [Cocleimonas sp. KMM 6892]|uniref:3-methyl-2-oxobutanoate hydroxymethyltransferase n=1 Tax=unclassified Cocleimonas TaxID=2639732 RepID=UPI002DB9ADBC|nr:MULTISPECIES: 3-methyl-2-oxobutanoate hydroxymethyltransferase [unclassified Cocleimonas]MEB8431687.1 3-methyl-2-oxobutanoate hydroxymethyltransferase [Cocleimonas sp. KMM 6892]MEC4713541.1 3-methyl-2-oxobutanoate hydroxymethyltransferase [Cocleimonas sp. KMM 6895]MEC4742872.1 3-methyl-2-oxobutanoate hydroxymethyltransferase [Cocleimonas sp. KMM 6896]
MPNRVTVRTIREMKSKGEKIVSLTAYDSSFARVVDEQGVDVILVGDSLGMVMQGHDSTVPVSVDDIIYHSRAVEPQTKRALVMADLPFMSYTNPDQAIGNAARLMQEGRAHIVKLEGGEAQLDTVRHMTRHGVPVCAHIGLTPQTVHKLGGYRVQGREDDAAKQMLSDALALQDAGADAVVLECVPVDLAQQLTEELEIPTIGIGAGRSCDGQVLVLQDMIGISSLAPKFSLNFLKDGRGIPEAIKAYVDAVRDLSFPTDDQCFF